MDVESCPFGELAHLRKKRTWLKIPAVRLAHQKKAIEPSVIFESVWSIEL
jgi:hypothetical protein